jgi:predicted metalloprotease
MVETIDSKQNDSAILQAMAIGKDTLKKMHEETTVEDVWAHGPSVGKVLWNKS